MLLSGKHSLNIDESLVLFDIKDQSQDFSLDFEFKDKTTGTIKFKIRYRPITDKLPEIYKSYRQNYKDRYLIPEVRNTARTILSDYFQHELTPDNFTDNFIHKTSDDKFLDGYFQVQAFIVNDIKFSQLAIDAKDQNLDLAYTYLNLDDVNKRLEAIDLLFKSKSKTAYEIILDHWSHENDKKVKGLYLDQNDTRIKTAYNIL